MSVQVTGVLRDAVNNPVANGTIKIITLLNFGAGLNATVTYKYTDANGLYDFTLVDGTYGIEVRTNDAFMPLGSCAIDAGVVGPVTLVDLFATAAPASPSEISYMEQLRAEAQTAAGQSAADVVTIAADKALVAADKAQVAADKAAAEQAKIDALAAQAAADLDVLLVASDKNTVAGYKQAIEDLMSQTNAPPPISTVVIEAGPTWIKVIPDVTNLNYYDEVEFYYRGQQPEGARVFYSRGRSYLFEGLPSETLAYFSVRSVNTGGASTWYDFLGTTTGPNTDALTSVGLSVGVDYGTLIGDLQSGAQVQAILSNTFSKNLGSIMDKNGAIEQEMFNFVLEYGNFRASYEDRQLELEKLTAVNAYRDPQTGQLVSLAGLYADALMANAQAQIDTMDGKVDVYAAHIDNMPGGAGVNLMVVPYSTFETELDPPFTSNGAAGSVAVYRTDDLGQPAILGPYCLEFTTTGPDHWCYFGASPSDYNIAVVPGKKWIVSFYVYAPVETGKNVQGYFRRNSDGGYLSFTATTDAVAGTWKRVSGVLDLTGDTSDAVIFRADYDGWGGSGAHKTYMTGFMIEQQITSLTEPSAFVRPPEIIASSSAIQALLVDVANNADGISANGAAITLLESTVNDPTTGVVANADAIDTLNTTVTSQGNTITAHSNSINALNAEIISELVNEFPNPRCETSGSTLHLDSAVGFLDNTFAYEGTHAIRHDSTTQYSEIWQQQGGMGAPLFTEVGEQWTIGYRAKNTGTVGLAVGYPGGGGYGIITIPSVSDWTWYTALITVPTGFTPGGGYEMRTAGRNGSLYIDSIVLVRGHHTLDGSEVLSVDGRAVAVDQMDVRVTATEGTVSSHASKFTTLEAITETDYSKLSEIRSVTIDPGGLTNAEWMVKTNVNGHVSGFGLYNTGQASNFIIAADGFAIADPADVAPVIYPFSVVGGVTYIDTAVIQDAGITNAKIGNTIQSANYPTNGWKLDKTAGIEILDQDGNIMIKTYTGSAPDLGPSIDNNYATPFTLIAQGTGTMDVQGASIGKKSGAVGWNTQVYSKEFFTGGAFASFTLDQTDRELMVGLNSDPLTNASYTSIDYAIYATAGAAVQVYESGIGKGSFGTYAVGDTFSVIYDGVNVRYLHNGTVIRTVSVAANLKLAFDSSFSTVGGYISNVQVGPYANMDWGQVGGAGKPEDYANIATVGGNMLTDGRFNQTYYGGFGAYWKDQSASVSVTLDGEDGGPCLRMNAAGSSVVAYSGQLIEINDGDTFVLRGKVYLSSEFTGKGTAAFRIEQRLFQGDGVTTAAGSWSDFVTKNDLTPGAWVAFEKKLTLSTTDGRYMRLLPFVDASMTTGYALVDELFLYRANDWVTGIAGAGKPSDNATKTSPANLMNLDPFMTGNGLGWSRSVNSWIEISTDSEFSWGTDATSPSAGGTVLIASSDDDLNDDFWSEVIPIDPSKAYRMHIWVKQPTGNKKNYLSVNFRDASGNNIVGNSGSDATGWTAKGSYHYWTITNAVFPTSWTRYEFGFGGDNTATIPTGAVSAQIGALCLREPATTQTEVRVAEYALYEDPKQAAWDLVTGSGKPVDNATKDDPAQLALTGGSVCFNPDMEIKAADGRPAGWYASYSNANQTNVAFKSGDPTVLELHHASDTGIGVSGAAFAVVPGAKYKIRIRVSVDVAAGSGFYFRIQELDTELPLGGKFIVHGVAESEAGAVEDTRQISTFRENQAIGTAWEEYEFTYTPTATAKYASPLFLNWLGMGTNSLYVDRCYIALEANYITDTNELTDTANLGGTAIWSGVTGTGRPADDATKDDFDVTAVGLGALTFNPYNRIANIAGNPAGWAEVSATTTGKISWLDQAKGQVTIAGKTTATDVAAMGLPAVRLVNGKTYRIRARLKVSNTATGNEFKIFAYKAAGELIEGQTHVGYSMPVATHAAYSTVSTILDSTLTTSWTDISTTFVADADVVATFFLYKYATITGLDVDYFYVVEEKAAAIKDQTGFATLSQITSANASTYIANLAVGNAQIANLAVDNGKIANLAVDNGKIANLAVTSGKIANLAVGNAQIANAAITNAKIGTAAVDTLELAGQAVTIPSSAYTSASQSFGAETTLQSVTFTATGNPVVIWFNARFRMVGIPESSASITLKIYRGTTQIESISVGADYTWENMLPLIIKDTPSSGSVTYYAKASGSGSPTAQNRSLVTLEVKR